MKPQPTLTTLTTAIATAAALGFTAAAPVPNHYCTRRPHGGKHRNLMTPMAYYQQLAEAA